MRTKTKLSASAFIRSQPINAPTADVVAAAKKVGLTITKNYVSKQQYEMRKGFPPNTPASVEKVGLPITQLLSAGPPAPPASSSQVMDSLELVCEALRPLSREDADRVISCARLLTGQHDL